MSVPVYGQPRVETAPLSGVRANPNAPSAAFGVPAVVDPSGAAAIVTKRAQQEADYADEMVVNAAERKLADHRTNLMAAAMDHKGHDALAAASAVPDAWKKGVDEIASTLTTDRQKAKFAQREQGYWANLYENVESHAHAESRKADASDTDALIKIGLDQVNHDPATADHTAEVAKARVADFGARNGWSTEQIAEKAAEHVSDVYATAISRLVASEQYDAAAKYLTTHRAELRGKQLDDAEHLVDTGQAQGLGLREADRILGINQTTDQLPTPEQAQGIQQQPTAPKTMAQALVEAEAIKDPRARKAATQEIVAHFTHMETAQRYDREAARARMVQKVEANGGRLNRADPDWLKISGFPEGEHVEHRSDQLLRPPKDPGDPESFLTKVQLASTNPASRQAFMQETLNDWDGMNTAQKTHLVNLQRQFRTTDDHATNEAIKAATSEALRWQHVAETETLKGEKGDKEKVAEAMRLQHAAESKAAQLRHSPIADDSTIPFHDFGAPAGSVRVGSSSAPAAVDRGSPIAGILSPAITPIHPTRQMLEEAAQSPAYAAALRNMGVLLPKVLPAPVAPK